MAAFVRVFDGIDQFLLLILRDVVAPAQDEQNALPGPSTTSPQTRSDASRRIQEKITTASFMHDRGIYLLELWLQTFGPFVSDASSLPPPILSS